MSIALLAAHRVPESMRYNDDSTAQVAGPCLRGQLARRHYVSAISIPLLAAHRFPESMRNGDSTAQVAGPCSRGRRRWCEK